MNTATATATTASITAAAGLIAEAQDALATVPGADATVARFRLVRAAALLDRATQDSTA